MLWACEILQFQKLHHPLLAWQREYLQKPPTFVRALATCCHIGVIGLRGDRSFATLVPFTLHHLYFLLSSKIYLLF